MFSIMMLTDAILRSTARVPQSYLRRCPCRSRVLLLLLRLGLVLPRPALGLWPVAALLARLVVPRPPVARPPESARPLLVVVRERRVVAAHGLAPRLVRLSAGAAKRVGRRRGVARQIAPLLRRLRSTGPLAPRWRWRRRRLLRALRGTGRRPGRRARLPLVAVFVARHRPASGPLLPAAHPHTPTRLHQRRRQGRRGGRPAGRGPPVRGKGAIFCLPLRPRAALHWLPDAPPSAKVAWGSPCAEVSTEVPCHTARTRALASATPRRGADARGISLDSTTCPEATTAVVSRRRRASGSFAVWPLRLARR